MIAFLLVLVTLAPAGAVGVKLPEPSQLAQAARSGDDVELERIAARLGPGRLERVAEKGSRAERLAALRALALIENGWSTLPELARLLGDGQAEVAEQAAVSARRIAEGMSPEMLEREDVPRDVPMRASAELLKQAARPELLPSVRVAAISAVAALRGVARIDEGALQKLLSDGESQVRRAAAESLAGVVVADRALEQSLAADADAKVAAAAAASLCRDVPPVATPKSPAEQRAARLGPPARTRLRALAVDESLSLADRLDLMGCLRVAAGADDKAVLDQLAKKSNESVKRRAKSLGGK
jgi:hypothetical protein